MNRLDPKSVWLFFIANIFRFALVLLILFSVLGPFLATWLGYEAIVERADEQRLANFLFRGGLTGTLLLYIVLVLVLAYIWARLSYYFYRYELTENGFRKEYGVIWKSYVTIPCDRIQNVDIYRGPLARILGLSDIQIQTAGMSNVGARFAEGRLPGLSLTDAENLRNELIQRAGQNRNQGL